MCNRKDKQQVCKDQDFTYSSLQGLGAKPTIATKKHQSTCTIDDCNSIIFSGKSRIEQTACYHLSMRLLNFTLVSSISTRAMRTH